jgi:hypothetical protein
VEGEEGGFGDTMSRSSDAGLDADQLLQWLQAPSVESWREIVIEGKRAVKQSRVQMAVFEMMLDRHLKEWPKELERVAPAWPESWQRRYEHRVREVDTYGAFLAGICGDPRLKLHDGLQAVQLARKYVGAARDLYSEKRIKVNQAGEGDLGGTLTVEWRISGGWRRLARPLEVDVKKPEGRPEESQKLRQQALVMRGGLYLYVRTVEEAVGLILVAISDTHALLRTYPSDVR